MRKNDSDFYMLVGRVEEVTDEGNRYVVKVSYEIFNRVRRQEETVMTTVYFQDQQSRMDDKKPIPWVQIARGKNIRPGRTVAMIVYFTGNDFAEAYGYGIYYSGVVGLGAERSEDVKYSIGGTVNWMEDKIDNAGTPYLSMNVFFGYDRYGNAASAIVQVRDPVLMETCKRMLAPLENLRWNAWFKCGKPYRFEGRNRRIYDIYTATDMTRTNYFTREAPHENQTDQNPELQGQEL